MNKKLNIFGRKVPVLAVMMVLLVIGTASAALIENYANLSGDVTVTNPISVYDSNGALTTTTVVGDLDFNSPAIFTITNSGINDATVELAGSILPADDFQPDTIGLSITYSVEGGSIPEGTTQVLVPGGDVANPGQSVVTVTLNAVPNIEPGTYIVTVAVNPV